MANTTGKKFGGRVAGTPNKATAAMRERLQNFFDGDWEKALSDWQKLTPGERWKYRGVMLKFVMPAMANVDINDVSENKNNGILSVVDKILGK